MTRLKQILNQLFNINEIRRSTDLDVLWPLCKNYGDDLAHAKQAFTNHCLNDPAWLALGTEEIHKRIEALK